MKFVRLICLNITDKIDDLEFKLPGDINGYKIGYLGGQQIKNSFFSIWYFEKALEAKMYTVDSKGLNINKGYLEECHELIKFFSSYISVVYQLKLSTTSPMPSFSIIPESDEEKVVLSKSGGLAVSRNSIYSEDFTFEIIGEAFELLNDRAEGLEILSLALKLNSDMAKYKEYVRLFEIAFGYAGAGLYKPLLRFLHEGGNDFSKKEVKSWFGDLRSRAIHADKREPIFELEISVHVQKMKLAAYDVLFNKVNWKDHGHERRKGLVSISGPGFLTQGKEAKLGVRLFDSFGVFPLNLSAPISSNLPTDWWYEENSNKANSHGKI